MARPLRIQYPGACYHITCRGNEKAEIFKDDRDRRKFLDILAESALTFDVEVHCYCLMANHFHLLLKTQLANLDRFMQQFNTAYIVYFNWIHQRTGHLYQGRYKAILVDADRYLLALSQYIHLNPIRTARFINSSPKEKIIALERYPWSSYRAYIGLDRAELVRRGVVFNMFGVGGADKEIEYKRFVEKGLTGEIKSPLLEKKAHSVLGGEEFVRWTYDNYIKTRKEEPEFSGLNQIKPALPVEDIVEVVAKEFGTETDQVIRGYARAGGARIAAVEFCCRHAILDNSLKQIGEKLGLSVPGMVRARQRFRGKVDSDRIFRERSEKVAKLLGDRRKGIIAKV